MHEGYVQLFLENNISRKTSYSLMSINHNEVDY